MREVVEDEFFSKFSDHALANEFLQDILFRRPERFATLALQLTADTSAEGTELGKSALSKLLQTAAHVWVRCWEEPHWSDNEIVIAAGECVSILQRAGVAANRNDRELFKTWIDDVIATLPEPSATGENIDPNLPVHYQVMVTYGNGLTDIGRSNSAADVNANAIPNRNAARRLFIDVGLLRRVRVTDQQLMQCFGMTRRQANRTRWLTHSQIAKLLGVPVASIESLRGDTPYEWERSALARFGFIDTPPEMPPNQEDQVFEAVAAADGLATTPSEEAVKRGFETLTNKLLRYLKGRRSSG